MNSSTDSTGERPTPLELWLVKQIREVGPITVAEFMGHALYHPDYGYYTTGPNIGPRGDFVTSPEASPAFGRLFATHISDVDALLGKPSTFHVIEFGPGRGTLALDLLGEVQASNPELYGRLKYWLVDISPALRALQQSRLLPEHGTKVEWLADAADLPRGLAGAVIANEVVDAFPVHVIEMHDGYLHEQCVNADENGKLTIEHKLLSNQRLLSFLSDAGIELADGEQIEVNLDVDKWLADLSEAFERGVVTLIDYGDESPGRYSPTRREGTLLGYYAGTVTDSILAHPGQQDLTALVDFTALRRSAEGAGFNILGATRQANFLLGLGLGTTHKPETAINSNNIQELMQYRKGLQSLISMDGLGRFHVLLLTKGLEEEGTRQGLSALKYAVF